MFFVLLSVFLKSFYVVLDPLLRVQTLGVEELDWRVAPSTKVKKGSVTTDFCETDVVTESFLSCSQLSNL